MIHLEFKDWLSMTPQLILVVGGLGVLVSQLILKKNRVAVAWQLSILTVLLALITVVFGLSDARGATTFLPRAFYGQDVAATVGGTYRYSAFSANALLFFLVLTFLTLLMMRTLTQANKIEFAENYFLLLMSVVGYAYAVCAEDFVTLFVGLELGSLPVVVLVGMNRRDPSSNEAAIKYLLLSSFSMAFLLLGIALLYGAHGTLRLSEIRSQPPHYLKTQMVLLGYACVFIGFLFKVSAFPLHSYVADVYEGSATIFTAVLSSLSKVAGLLLLFKISMNINDGYRAYIAPVLTFAAIGSMLFGAFAMLATQNVKRILAYSSIAHVGFMLCFFTIPATADIGVMGALKQEGGAGLIIYAIGYTFAALLSFGAVGFIEMRSETRESVTLHNLNDIHKRDPKLAWFLALPLISFIGIPPLAGFFGKYFLFKYLAFSNNLILAAAAAAASGISVYGYIRIIRPLLFGEGEHSTQEGGLLRSDSAKLSFGILSVAITFFAAMTAFLYNTGIVAVQKIY
ncbi:MAG: NADH-quinone oxidoreductase subunit N [Spirochaetes bacterium]|nr:NADH-quinone oxidoreductase subunit N [Spirochaetota bacterium]